MLRLANQGWEKACKTDKTLAKGLNIVNGRIVYDEIAEAFNWEVGVV